MNAVSCLHSCSSVAVKTAARRIATCPYIYTPYIFRKFMGMLSHMSPRMRLQVAQSGRFPDVKPRSNVSPESTQLDDHIYGRGCGNQKLGIGVRMAVREALEARGLLLCVF